LLTIRDLAWQADQISFSKASLTTGYSVSDQQLKLSKLQGKIFGGSVTGDAELNQWLAADQHLSPAARKSLETATISAAHPLNKSHEAVKPKPPAVQSALIVLRLRDISAEDLAVALNAPTHPLQALHLAGLASGTVETRWKGTRYDAEVQFALDVSPPARTPPAQLPLTAHATGVYHAASDTLDLPQFNLTTPTSRVQASGTLSSTSAVRLSVSTSSLADWLPFARRCARPRPFSRSAAWPRHFQRQHEWFILLPATCGQPVGRRFRNQRSRYLRHARQLKTRWDSLSTSIQLSFQSVALHGATLRRGQTFS
jgi:hypothetical protein